MSVSPVHVLVALPVSTGCESLARGARMMEPVSESHAVSLYNQALDAYEDEGRAMQANEVYR